MEDQKSVKIRFEGLSVADGNRCAAELRSQLLDEMDDVEIEIEKDDPSTQDFGATLAIVLGTPAAIALAKGIAAYLSRAGTSIAIEAGGKVVAKGIRGEDAARIAEAFSSAT